MIAKIFKSVIKNFQTFLVIWAVVLIVNQLFIFHACFAPYCLIAALPHTLVIAVLILYFSIDDYDEQSKTAVSDKTSLRSGNDVNEMTLDEAHRIASEAIEKIGTKDQRIHTQPKAHINFEDFEDIKSPYCPKCSSKMVLKRAKKGKYMGEKFWACRNYPDCNGILNV